MIVSQEDIERLFQRVDFNGEGGCWNWTGPPTWDGYGQFHCGGETRTHRVSYKYFFREIPEGLLVRHSCNNRRCVNPLHLELGTHQDNMNDRNLAGRQARPKGEKNGMAVLTEEEVTRIREMISSGQHKQYEIAEVFCVSASLISHIKHGRYWRA